MLALSPLIRAQDPSQALKSQALVLMREARYGEAIDQLNKYIAANPRLSDGYHLRGLCYEKRTQYANSVYDLRQAIRLSPNETAIRIDLNRVISVWHNLLYIKIEGHKRDIAINPNHAFSYLEIGQSYRWLEQWENAEIWYDEYLKRDDNASPDEIIRYTEILTRTRALVKGERILKKFVERYPDDWRLWSRYGYFTLWLGKYKIAEDAFLASLGFKPFFKEAEDGLDLARKKGYLTQFDGTRWDKNERWTEPQEFPIDRLYRIVNKNPNSSDNSRLELAKELMKYNRLEEAYVQLLYLSRTSQGKPEFDTLWKEVTSIRDSTYNADVEKYTSILKENPMDKEAVVKLAQSYSNLFYYDSALEILSEYIQNVPDDQDLDVRFMYSKFAAWNYEWERSIEQLNKLLIYDPDNLEYKLLRSQISVWTVNDLDLAEEYLMDILDEQPNNVHALLATVALYSWRKDLPSSKQYLDRAQAIAPDDSEVITAQSNYLLHVQAFEEDKIFQIRGRAGNLAMSGRCDEALEVFEEYITKRTGLTREESLEYADVAACAGDYTKAIRAYDQVLELGFDYRVALMRAKAYFMNNDVQRSSDELESLASQIPDDYDAQLFLADTYAASEKLDKAEQIYRNLVSEEINFLSKEDFLRKITSLADYTAVAKDFTKSKDLYDEVLTSIDQAEKNGEPGFDISFKNDVLSRKMYLTDMLLMEEKYDDAEDLLDELTRTITDEKLRKDLFTKRMFLGDAFVTTEQFSRAEDMYDQALDMARDTADISMVKQRISWLPPSGFNRGLRGFGSALSYLLPTNISLSPFTSFYKDNQSLSLYNYGMRLDAGLFGFLGAGVSWSRLNINNNVIQRNFTQVKASGSIFFSKFLTVSGEYGQFQPASENKINIWGVSARYEKPLQYYISAGYENTDARIVLYSPNLMFTKIKLEIYRLQGRYTYKDVALLSAFYNYYNLSDGNQGNDLLLRFGRKFVEDSMFGYEFFYSDFGFSSTQYYSPQEFSSHSLWGEWQWIADKNLKGKIGGKIGYVPAVDYVISEFFAEATYNPLLSLVITGRVGYGNSFRYDSGYRSLSASVSAYWGIF